MCETVFRSEATRSAEVMAEEAMFWEREAHLYALISWLPTEERKNIIQYGTQVKWHSFKFKAPWFNFSLVKNLVDECYEGFATGLSCACIILLCCIQTSIH